MLRVALLLLTLWASAVHGFFPWMPQCDPSDTECKSNKWPTKRSVDGQQQNGELSSEGVTFELMQRRTPDLSEDPATRAARIAREAARLSLRYTRTEDHADLPKRENQFKFTTPVAPTGVHSTGIFQDGSDFSYFIRAEFGRPPKPLFMLLDSGASSTWVYESGCTTDACKNHNTFDPSGSSTFKRESTNVSIPYGKGQVTGYRGRDSLTVAGMPIEMSFSLINNASDIFQYFPFDGILGLSMVPSPASENYIQVLKAHQLVTSHMFSVSLNRNSDGPNTGQISFGSIDTSKYIGEIAYTPTVRNASGEWAIPLGDVTYGGKTAGVPKTRLAYLDTGTTYIFGPPADVKALHELIPGATTEDNVNWHVPCNTTGMLSLTFSGITYDIDPRDWMPGKGGKDAMCLSNIYGDEVVTNAWLLGDVFLKNAYTVFDGEEHRVGLAKKPPPPPQPASSTIVADQPATTGMIAPSPANPSVNAPGSSSAAAETSPSPSPTVTSPGDQLESNKYVSILCIVGIIAMVA